MNTFDQQIVNQFEAHPEWKEQHPAVWRVVKSRPSKRRTRRLARMEEEARRQLGIGPEEMIDWSKVDWLKVIQWVAAIMTIVLLIF